MPRFAALAFDADDTLWHTESLFADTQAMFREVLAPYRDPEEIERRLFETEVRNLRTFGYGIKGFTLSMIETAVELSDRRIGAREVQRIVDLGRAMLAAPVDLLPGVAEAVAALGERYPLLLITKGDLFDQESKIARSGIAERFASVHVVSEKSPEVYAALLAERGVEAERFVMVGNSLRSDVLPVLSLGGEAVHIPYAITWQHEVVEAHEADGHRYFELAAIRELPPLLERLEAGAAGG